MEIVLAKSAGFCFGVKRAVETVYEQAKTADHIYTYGPIIHNEVVVKDLKKHGVDIVDGVEDLDKAKGKTVIIRSHGISKSVNKRILEIAETCIDATCPFVKRIHRIVEEESNKGKQIIIIGNPVHPEVEGICGWSKTPAIVVESAKEAMELALPESSELCVVSQTTFNYNKFQELVEIIAKKYYNTIVVNTICNATEERQTEAKKIASSVDAMIVIGDAHSSNTKKLYEICKKECEKTYFIQTLDDLQLDLPNADLRVGITAGASTPNTIIEEVQSYVRNIF